MYKICKIGTLLWGVDMESLNSKSQSSISNFFNTVVYDAWNWAHTPALFSTLYSFYNPTLKQVEINETPLVYFGSKFFSETLSYLGSGDHYIVEGIRKGVDKFGTTYLSSHVSKNVKVSFEIPEEHQIRKDALGDTFITDVSIAFANSKTFAEIKDSFFSTALRLLPTAFLSYSGWVGSEIANSIIGNVFGQVLDNLIANKNVFHHVLQEACYSLCNGSLEKLLKTQDYGLHKKYLFMDKAFISEDVIDNKNKIISAITEATEEMLRHFDVFDRLEKHVYNFISRYKKADDSVYLSDQGNVKIYTTVPNQADVPAGTTAQASVDVKSTAQADKTEAINPILDFSDFKPAEVQEPVVITTTDTATQPHKQEAEPLVHIDSDTLVLPKHDVTVEA